MIMIETRPERCNNNAAGLLPDSERAGGAQTSPALAPTDDLLITNPTALPTELGWRLAAGTVLTQIDCELSHFCQGLLVALPIAVVPLPFP
jgi:hypothetical protein